MLESLVSRKALIVVGLCCSAAATAGAQTANQISITSAASYAAGKLAPNAIGSAFGPNLAPSVVSATSVTLPYTLEGVTVKIKDSSGALLPAQIFFVSPGQVNFLVPAETKGGAATVQLTTAEGRTLQGAATVTNTAPALFSATADGKGIAIAVLDRYGADGKLKSSTPVFRWDDAAKKIVANPVVLGTAAEKAYLVLYATGIRNNPGLSSVRVRVGGTDCQVAYAAAQTEYAGLDQINALLPVSLAGRGDVPILVTVEGQDANQLSVNIASNPPPPAITSLNPSSGNVGDNGTTLTVSGSNLLGGQLQFAPPDGIQVNVTSVTATSITATLSIDVFAWTTSRSVTVTTDNGTSNKLTFTVKAVPTPLLSSVSAFSPIEPELGKTSHYQISGSNLSSVNAVNVSPPDGVTFSNVTATSSSVSFDISVAAGAAYGARKLSVSTSAGKSNEIDITLLWLDPSFVLSNLQAGPGSNNPYAQVPVSFDYSDPSGKVTASAIPAFLMGNSVLMFVYRSLSPATGTFRDTLTLSGSRWNIGITIPIKVWIDAPKGRRSNTLIGAFDTK
jgi:uncharacterized protein (TIGR03437 family)